MADSLASPKRQFCISFVSPVGFKNICDILGHVLIDVCFILEKKEGGTVMSVDTIDPPKCCCVKMSYPVEIAHLQDSRVQLTVNMKKMNGPVEQNKPFPPGSDCTIASRPSHPHPIDPLPVAQLS